MTTHVYRLVDPRDRIVRYVGMTAAPPRPTSPTTSTLDLARMNYAALLTRYLRVRKQRARRILARRLAARSRR